MIPIEIHGVIGLHLVINIRLCYFSKAHIIKTYFFVFLDFIKLFIFQ